MQKLSARLSSLKHQELDAHASAAAAAAAAAAALPEAPAPPGAPPALGASARALVGAEEEHTLTHAQTGLSVLVARLRLRGCDGDSRLGDLARRASCAGGSAAAAAPFEAGSS